MTKAKWLDPGTPLEADRLRAERLFDLHRHLIRIPHLSLRGKIRFQPGNTLRRRIDRAAYAAVAGFIGTAQGDEQIVQPQHGAARILPDDFSLVVHFPTLGRSGEHEIMPLRIDEHIFDPLQTGQIPHFIGQRLTGLLHRGDRLLQPAQRNHPQLRWQIQIAGQLSQRRPPFLREVLQRVGLDDRQHAVRANRHAPDGLLNDLSLEPRTG